MESENERLYDEALTFWAARGWTRPPGALDARLYEVSVEHSRALADINEKILIEQARLAHEMEKFIVTAGLEREKMVMDYTNQAHTRAFEAAKAVQEYALKTFEVKVLWYNAQMEAYKIAAQVYATRIQAELGKVELFKAQLEAAKTQVAIQQGEIQLYLAQLQGVTTVIELYKSQIQAAALLADINKVKLELFRLQVESYHVQVQAKVAEYDLYKAQLSGEQMKVQTFSEMVKAYAIRLDAIKTEIEAKRTEVVMTAEVNKDRIQSMLGRIERFKILRTTDMETIKALTQVYEVQERLYGDDIKLVEADLKAQTEIYHGNLTKAKNQTDVLLKEAELNLQSYLQNRTLAIEAARAGANVCSQLAASSLSAVHAGANIGYSGSESTGVSESRSESESTQTVYQHIYNES